ncbi:hypothetical protein VNO77_21723 [Canavalia gladiata]|uniref:Uncharacterized protein n=1 Tax=Canavalia gladiata TaxID=3824 RepID=A0AAN9L4R4_CANGL
MIIRVSFMLVASVAALKISQTKTSSSIKRNGTIKSPGSNGSTHLEQEFGERENSTANTNHVIQNEEEKQISFEKPQNMLRAEFKDFELLIGGEKIENVTEKEILQNLVQDYKQRELDIERKLLELNGLREEQLAIAQHKRQLKEKTAKLDSLKNIIASLQSESKIMLEKIKEDLLSKTKLDIAKRIIYEMQRKKDVNGNPVKKQILMLQQQVTELQKYNSSCTNPMVNKKLKDLQDIEFQVLELKRRNEELELEKREMGVKLATAKARIRIEHLQQEREARIKEEITGLRHVHEELSEKVEMLQRNRFDMVQELVYQRWLYTLLRYEVHNHQNQSGNSESVSSNATLDESDEIETTTFESSSSSHSSSSSNNKSSMPSKVKRWREPKISSKSRNFPNSPGLICRFSMSMVASDMPKSRIMNSSSKSLENQIVAKKKRVSFSDSIKLSTYQDIAEAIENAISNKETRTSSVVTWDKHKVEKYEEPRNSNQYAVGNSLNPDSNAKKKIFYSRNKPVCRKDQRVKTILLQLFSATMAAQTRPTTTTTTTTSSSLLPKLREHVSNSGQLFGVLTLLITGTILLFLTGLTVVGTILGLILFLPLIILTSPIWVPIFIVFFLATAVFLSMCGFAVVVVAVLTWMYRYFRGFHSPGSDRIDYALNRNYETASRVKHHGGGSLQSKPMDTAPGA